MFAIWKDNIKDIYLKRKNLNFVVAIWTQISKETIACFMMDNDPQAKHAKCIVMRGSLKLRMNPVDSCLEINDFVDFVLCILHESYSWQSYKKRVDTILYKASILL